MGRISGIAFLATFLGVLFLSEACVQKFKRAEDFANYTKTCFTKAGFGKAPSAEEMLKGDFDDKCASKCILASFDLIDDEGHVDKDALSDFLQENVAPQSLLKVNEMASSCVDSTGSDKVKGSKQGTTPDECKAVAKFFSCFVTASNKLC